jgi:hypothetical protein
MTATADLLADLGVEVVAVPTEDPGAFVVALVIGDIFDAEDSAEQAAEQVYARLCEAMEADLSAPLRVPAERLSLAPGRPA